MVGTVMTGPAPRRDTGQSSIFVSDTLHFNERWQLIAGLRFNQYDNEGLNGGSGYQTQRTSPTLALIYKPGTNTSIYASYVEALEPGTRVADFTFNPPDFYVNAGQILPATVSKQAEIGIKHQSESVELSAAVFRIQRANQMEVQVVSGPPDGYLVTQDALVVYRGVEVTGAYQVTRQLNLGLGAVYLDAVIDKVADSTAGNTPANAPKWQVVATTEYKVPGIDGLRLHGDARYFGKTYVDDANEVQVPGRTIFNAGLSHDFKIQNLDSTLYFNLNNVFNKKYWANGGWGSGNLGEERNASLTLRTVF